jgi:hypothetical protein
MTLKDKVALYENFLKRLAAIDVEKEMKEALEHPSNSGNKPGDLFISKYPFAFGMVSQSFKSVVRDIRNALTDTGVEWRK